MPFLLILGPIFGFAALAVLVAHAHKGPSARALPSAALASRPQQFELDHGLPDHVVHEVLGALVHVQDPSALDTLATKHGPTYPLVARELRAKATTLRSGKPTGAEADLGDAAMILQAAMKALTQETDPVELEGFADSIRAKYPTASLLMLERAHELRGAQPAPDGATALTAPAEPSNAVPSSLAGSPAAGSAGRVPVTTALPSPAASPHPPAATYVVQPGDTPSLIAEKLVHDGKRWPELVAANPARHKSADGSFASLRPGDGLSLPSSWSLAPAHPPASQGPFTHETQP